MKKVFLLTTVFVLLLSFTVSSLRCTWGDWFKLRCKNKNNCEDFKKHKRELYASTKTITGEKMNIICKCNEKEIVIDQGKLSVVKENSFKQCKKLKMISFYKNNITTIPGGAFKGLKALEHLNLGGNKLTIINDKWFTDLKLLKEFQLHENQISLVPPKILFKLPNLKTLILSENKLTTFNIDKIAQLTVLHLASNAFSCTEIDKLKSELKKMHTDMIEHKRSDCHHVSTLPDDIKSSQSPSNLSSFEEPEKPEINWSSCKIICSITLLIIASVVTGVNGLILILFVFRFKIAEITF